MRSINWVWLVIVLLFLYSPLLFMLVFSFNSTKQDGHFSGFSLRWYVQLLEDERLIGALWQSIQIGLYSACLATCIAILTSVALIRYPKFTARNIFLGTARSPLITPDVILGLSLLLFFVWLQRNFGWPERGMFTVIIGHTLLGTAYAIVIIQARLAAIDTHLEEAALDLGAKPLAAFILVTLPNIAHAIIAAFLLAFTLSFDDVVIAEFLAGPGVNTLPQVVFHYARRGINPTIYAAASVFIVVLSIAVLAVALLVYKTIPQRLHR